MQRKKRLRQRLLVSRRAIVETIMTAMQVCYGMLEFLETQNPEIHSSRYDIVLRWHQSSSLSGRGLVLSCNYGAIRRQS